MLCRSVAAAAAAAATLCIPIRYTARSLETELLTLQPFLTATNTRSCRVHGARLVLMNLQFTATLYLQINKI